MSVRSGGMYAMGILDWVLAVCTLLLLLTLTACGGILEVGVERAPIPRHESALGQLAYVQGGDIWVRDLRSFPDGEPRRLTTDGVNAGPRWSPSGQWLAFRKGEYQVWLARADGSVARPLNEGAAVGPFAWAPTADRLAYVAGESELRAINADGTGPATLVLQSPYGRVGHVAWSPDGAWIAYEWWEQQPEQALSDQGLWKVSADGRGRSKLYASGVPEKGETILAGWSSDGRFLFFWQGEILSASMLADGVPLYALPAAGGTPVLLAECVLVHSDFVVAAPAGTAQLAIVNGGGRGTWTNKALYVTRVAGGGGVAVTSPEVAASSPAWSPDARWVAYAAMPDRGDLVGGESARQGLMERRLWVTNVEGEPRARQLTDDSAYRDEYPLWSADGSHLLFARLNTEGQASLWLIPAEGGDPHQVVEELTPLPGPASGWFGYYGHVDWDQVFDWWRGPVRVPEPQEPTPALVPTETAVPVSGLICLRDGAVYVLSEVGEQPIGVLPEDAGHLALSERYLAYVSDNQIQALSLADGTARTLLDFGQRPGLDFDLRWARDGSVLAYAVAWDEPDGSRQVELGTADGYQQIVLDTLIARPAGPTPTPPLEPPMSPEPGFANLSILGFDRHSGRLVAMPVGGMEDKIEVWTYDVRGRQRVQEQPWPTAIAPSLIPVLSPDLTHLAVSVPGTLQIYQADHIGADWIYVELPAGMHATWLSWSLDGRRLGYLLNEGATPALDVSPSLELWVWESETGQSRQLMPVGSPEASLHGWTADGKALVLQMLDGIGRQVAVSLVDVATGEATSMPLPEGSRVLGWMGSMPQ